MLNVFIPTPVLKVTFRSELAGSLIAEDIFRLIFILCLHLESSSINIQCILSNGFLAITHNLYICNSFVPNSWKVIAFSIENYWCILSPGSNGLISLSDLLHNPPPSYTWTAFKLSNPTLFESWEKLCCGSTDVINFLTLISTNQTSLVHGLRIRSKSLPCLQC